MSILSKQWAGYAQVHANRSNFVVHLITVPAFMAGTVALLSGPFMGSIVVSVLGLLAMMLALAAQGWGHRQESTPPAPFVGKTDAVVRLMLEQWVTFPRYVVYRVFRAL